MVSIFLNALLRGLGRAWVLIVSLVIALSLVRLGQLAYFWPSGYQAPYTDVALVVLQGFRFDLKVSAIAGFLLLLVLPWVSGRINAYIGVAIAFIYIMMSLINLHYFGFYKTPIDAMVFGLWEDDTSAVLKTIWHDFPVVLTLILGIGLTAGTVAGHRWWPVGDGQVLPAVVFSADVRSTCAGAGVRVATMSPSTSAAL